MTKTQIFSIVMIPVVGLMGYLLYDSVASEIRLAEAIKKSEAKVIEKLKMIRDAEKAYFKKKGVYTDNWDSLVTFVAEGELYIIEEKEKVTPRDRDDPDYYKGDIVEVVRDTIGVEKVQAKLFPQEKYPNFKPENLPLIPGTDGKKFEIYAGKVEKGITEVSVVQVVDRHPMDKTRSEENPSRTRWPLRFGSKTDVTLSGNWE